MAEIWRGTHIQNFRLAVTRGICPITRWALQGVPHTFIGRFDTFAEGYAKVRAMIGLGDEEAPALLHLNKSRQEHVRLRDYDDATLQDQVYRRYRADFDALEYPPRAASMKDGCA